MGRIEFLDILRFVWIASIASSTRILSTFKLSEGSTAHDLKSDPIVLINEKTIQIPNLYYDGKGPDAYWMVGYEKPPPERPESTPGQKIPNELNNCNVLRKYNGDTIQLLLPANYTVNNVDWLAMYCIKYKHTFGWIDFKSARGEADFPDVDPAPPNLKLPAACGQDKVIAKLASLLLGILLVIFLN